MDLIQFALSYVGTKEGDSRHAEIINGYNQNVRPLPRGYAVKMWDAWCATFVSFCLWMCGYRDFPFECGVHEMWNKALQMGIQHSIPQKGFAVIYDWDLNGRKDHVGIITNIIGTTLEVVEGNYNNRVKVRRIEIGDSCITGYIDTGYREVIPTPAQPEPVQPEPVQPVADLDAIAREVIKGNYGNGQERKDRLTAAGYDAAAVQKRVNEILSGKVDEPAQEPALAQEPDAQAELVDTIARQVIRGEWGNGAERRTRLASAGYDYTEIQARVNALLRG